MNLIKTAARKAGHGLATTARAIGRAARKILPDAIAGHEKAIAAYVSTVIAAQIAHHLPNVHLNLSLIQQAIAAALPALTVWLTTNTTPEA